MLLVNVDSAERLSTVSKKKCCFLPSRSSKDQRCPIDHNKSGFHFQRQESFLSVRLIQVFDNRPLINTFKHRRNKSWEFASAANYEKHTCFVSSWSQVAADDR